MVEPLTIRVDRPYATEEEFLEAEAWSLAARSMLLIDVAPLPEGTVLRCELRLTNGHALVVAEGVVAKHLEATATRPAGLVVRYKRMSAASSDFVKRATERSAGSRIAPSSPGGSSPDSAVTEPTERRPSTKAPPRSSTATSRRNTSVPPGRVTRTSKSEQPPARGQRSEPQPPQSHHGPHSEMGGPRARSVSVVPPARRSSAPPSRTKQSRPPTRSSSLPPKSQTSRGVRVANLTSTKTASSQGSTAVGAPGKTRRSAPPKSQGARHDAAAIQRLRSRGGTKAISSPPDREAILARLKTKPSS